MLLVRCGVTVAVALTALSATPRARAVADEIDQIVVAVSERVRSYYDRITTIVCTESVSQQELRNDSRPRGKPRDFVYELLVTREPSRTPEATFEVKAERQLKLVNGRPPRRRDQRECTDPQSAYTDPLTFLLPENRPRYRFAVAKAPGSSASVIVLDFDEIETEPTRITWKGNCFTANGGRASGRVSIDRASYDVVELQTRLAESFRLATPFAMDVSGARGFLTVERSDTSVRYRTIDFQSPDETILLPQSIVTVTTIIGASTPRMRTTQTFTNFRRFLTDVKIRPERAE